MCKNQQLNMVVGEELRRLVMLNRATDCRMCRRDTLARCDGGPQLAIRVSRQAPPNVARPMRVHPRNPMQ